MNKRMENKESRTQKMKFITCFEKTKRGEERFVGGVK